MPDSGRMDVISKLHEVDPVFREVVDMLFGDTVDPRELYDISKLNDSSEYHVNGALQRKKDRRKRQATAALSATGAAAGVAGLAYGANDMRNAIKAGKKIKRSTKALVPLEVAGLAGEVMATHILHGDTKNKMPPQPSLGTMKKNVSDGLQEIIKARKSGFISTETAIQMADDLVTGVQKGIGRHAQTRSQLISRAERAEGLIKDGIGGRKTALKLTALGAGGVGVGAGYAAGASRTRKQMAPPQPTPSAVAKVEDGEADYGFVGEISKFDTDKRLAFGWCSLSTVDGEPVVDLQGDYAPIDEIEKSAYAYVTTSRVGGDMHAREGEAPKHTSDLVESFIATPDKLQQMGLSEEVAKSVPVGWWVGFKVNDDEQWAMVKDGRRAGFSIHGKGARVQKALG